MTSSRIVSAGLIASVLFAAPVSSAFADGPQRSHGATYHAQAYHGGGYHGSYWHGGGGYWRGGIWWPVAAVGAVVGTAAALVAAPFVAFGNAVASAPYYAPQQYYAPQPQQNYAPQGYNAPPPNYAPQQNYAPQGYNVPTYYPPVATTYYRQRAPAPVSTSSY